MHYLSLGKITAEIGPMDINANLHAMGRYGRLARIGAVVCLLVACLLLLASLTLPINPSTSELPLSTLALRTA